MTGAGRRGGERKAESRESRTELGRRGIEGIEESRNRELGGEARGRGGSVRKGR